MRINTNLISQNTYIQYTKNNNKIADSVKKLSSGYAINSAADNAAGLAISEKMRAQIRGLDQASSNAQDAISLVQTAEGSLAESTNILQRMREISVQSSSDTNEDKIDREALQDEFSQLQSELNDISKTTTYNKKNLLDGSLASKSASLTDVKLGNSSLAISLGKVSSGAYTFSVSKQLESAAVAAKDATGSAAMGSKASATFSSASVTAVPGGKGTALLNGNYSLETVANDDGTLTVTAKGDNDQVFTANVSASTLEGLASSAGAFTLDFASSAGANDGFTLSLTTSATISTTTNGLGALSDAINSTTVSVAGGVDKADATYGIYASLTGADSVKLNAGDTSVTFTNGVTVSFDSLTSADLDPTSTATNTLASVDNSVTLGDGTTKSTFSLDVKDLFGGTYTAGNAVAEGTDFNVNVGGKSYTYRAAAGDTQADVMTGLVAAANASKFSTEGATKTVNFTASSATSVITFGGDDTEDNTGITTTITTSGTSGSKYNYDKIFGDGSTASSKSTFNVSNKDNAGLVFQVGANEGDEMVINIDAVNCQALGINSAKVSSQESASAAIKAVDDAINAVSSQRAYLGAIENRLGYKIDNLDTSSENLTAAESQIRDVDMAKEMTSFTNSNILQQAATAMLAQANSLPQNVLSLLS